jgi:hypothetical protein
MAQRDYPVTLKWGTTLMRHYDDDYPLTQQCGKTSYYQALEDQLLAEAWEAYCRRDPAGLMISPNDFFGCVTWHIWSGALPRPAGWPASYGAYCQSADSAGELHVWIPYYDPTVSDPYRLPAGLSHEQGHALHYWARLWLGVPALREVEEHFERLFAQDGTAHNATAFPWLQANGVHEGPWERFADAYRALLGVGCTRGISGVPPEPGPVMPGFNDPLAIAGLKKRLQLLPGLSAFVRKFGMQPGTLRWQHQGDPAAGWWELRRATDGVLVAQTGAHDWHQSINNQWAPYAPAYTL